MTQIETEFHTGSQPVQWKVPMDLPDFEGHFPGEPILPAISLIEITTQILGLKLKKSCELSTVHSAKFTAPIRPGQTLQFQLDLVQENRWRVKVSDLDTHTVVCSLDLSVMLGSEFSH